MFMVHSFNPVTPVFFRMALLISGCASLQVTYVSFRLGLGRQHLQQQAASLEVSCRQLARWALTCCSCSRSALWITRPTANRSTSFFELSGTRVPRRSLQFEKAAVHDTLQAEKRILTHTHTRSEKTQHLQTKDTRRYEHAQVATPRGRRGPLSKVRRGTSQYGRFCKTEQSSMRRQKNRNLNVCRCQPSPPHLQYHLIQNS